MNDEQKENEIDKIFRKAIEPVNTEPSEGFWRKAAEDVIFRGNKLNERKTSRWRLIAFILGAALLMSGYFAYKMQNGLKAVEQQVAAVKNAQSQNIEKENANNTGNSIVDKTDGNSTIASTSKNVQQKTRPGIKPTEEYKVQNNNSSVKGNNGNKLQQPALAAFNKPSSKLKHTKKPVESIAANSKIVSNRGNNNTPGANRKEDLKDPDTTAVLVSVQKSNQNNIESSQPKTPDNVTKTNQPTIAVSSDTAKPLQNQEPAQINTASRFSVSVFFSPDFMIAYKFTNNNSYGSTTQITEKQNFSYTAGSKAEYELSSHFSISAGIAYQVFSFNSNPGYIYAQKQSDGDVGYYLPTSSGVVECPYYGAVNVGNSLKMSATSTRRYFEIPVSLKYIFISGEKYKVYLDVGMEANICVGESTTMDWQDYWNNYGVAIVNNTEGSSSMYFSYYIGLGAEYNIGKYLSLFAEPGLHNAITSIDNNVSVISYPRLFSASLGLTYHIK